MNKTVLKRLLYSAGFLVIGEIVVAVFLYSILNHPCIAGNATCSTMVLVNHAFRAEDRPERGIQVEGFLQKSVMHGTFRRPAVLDNGKKIPIAFSRRGDADGIHDLVEFLSN